MPLLILHVLVQVLLVLHVVKTGRDTKWIWLVMMLPVAGALVYLIVEVLPSIGQSRTGRRASAKMDQIINPDRHFNQASRNLSITNSIENRMAMAEQWMEKGQYQKAKALYLDSLVGVHKDDANILWRYSQSLFKLEDYEGCLAQLERIQRAHPGYQNAEAHLLYAQTLVALNRHQQAVHEFDALIEYFPGPEAKLAFVELALTMGQARTAMDLLEDILVTADQAPKHYQIMYKSLIETAKRRYKELQHQ